MSKAVLLQHAPYAGPGRIVSVFRDYGIPCETRHLYRGDEVPTDLDEIRVLVVLGGPMRVADIAGGKFPFLAEEVKLLERLIKADRPVLGIALGAQLLAHAAGAKVSPLDPGEIGWGAVTFPFPGGTEPMVFGLPDGSPMFHWHLDTFDLPALPPKDQPPGAPPAPTGSVLLSSSRLCKNQAFRFKTRLFGFQYHFECTQAEIEGLLEHDRTSWEKVLGGGGAEQIRSETRNHYARYARLGDRLLTNFVQFLRAY